MADLDEDGLSFLGFTVLFTIGWLVRSRLGAGA